MKVKHKQNSLAGFAPDLAPDALPGGAITKGQNVKATVRGWEKSDGYKESSFSPSNEKTHMMYWAQTEGIGSWFVAGLTTIEKVQANSALDVTRKDEPYQAGAGYSWNSVNFNGVVIFNNGADNPQYLGTKGRFENFPELDDKVRFRAVRPYKAYLIGLGVNLGSGYNDSEIYWSHPADPGFMPASWDYASASKDAGITTLPSRGVVLDSLELGNVNIVYKSDSTWLMRLVGGQWIFDISVLFSAQGILTTGCVTAFEKKHFVVTRTDIVIHDGMSSKSIAEKIVKDYFFDDLHRTHYRRTKVVKRPENTEIWVCYPSRNSEDGSCDKALIWDWTTGIWEPRTLPDLTAADFGYAASEKTVSWDELIGPWEQEGSWRLGEDALVFAPAIHMAVKGKAKLLLTSESGLYITDPIESVWEREDIVLGKTSRDGVPHQDYDHNKTVTRITFDVDTTEPFNVELGTKNELEDDVMWEDYGEFDPREGRHLDPFIDCAFLSVRLKTSAPDFELRNLGIEFKFSGDMW